MTTAMLNTTDSIAHPGDAASNPAKAKRARRAHPLASTRVQSILLLITLLGSWEAAVRFFKVPQHLVPPVSDIAVALWRGLATGPLAKDGFWYHGGVTVAEILLGFAIGSGVGLAIDTFQSGLRTRFRMPSAISESSSLNPSKVRIATCISIPARAPCSAADPPRHKTCCPRPVARSAPARR